MEVIDVIIVGSGIAGASAATALSNSGKNVVILDVGVVSEYEKNISTNFLELKKEETTLQSDFFLGKNFEAFQFSESKNIPQLSAQRKFITDLTQKFIPAKSANFFPVESLAFGGLGNAWGLGAYTFSDEELKKCGLPLKEIKESYKYEIERIGVSGNTSCDIAAYCYNGEHPIQNPLELNEASKHLLTKYQKRKAYLNKKGILIGNASLALLSKDLDDRKAYNYNDTDFYTNDNNSAYRPDFVIRNLIAQGKIKYLNSFLVETFTDNKEITTVKALNIKTKEYDKFYCKKLILACGTINTARIVLKSFESKDKLPVLCNPYSYLPMVYLPFLGKKNNDKQFGLAQLNLFYDKTKNQSDVVMASIYNYRSLLNFRLAQQMPFGIKNNLEILKLIVPSLFIAGIFYPTNYNAKNYVQLDENDSTVLVSNYEFAKKEQIKNKHSLSQIKKAFRQLHCFPLKTVNTLAGASIHYAGTLPFSEQPEKFRLAPNGKLHFTNSVFVADASGFSFLPAKGLSLTIMANAHYVATNCVKEI